MAHPAVQVTGLQAVIDAEAAARKELRVRILSGVLRLTREGVQGLLPPGSHDLVQVEGINSGRLQLRLRLGGVSAVADVLPEGTSAGRLRLKPTALRAGFFPLPAEMFANFGLALVPRAPGLHVVGGTLEIDFTELGAHLNLGLPPLRRVALGTGVAELHF